MTMRRLKSWLYQRRRDRAFQAIREAALEVGVNLTGIRDIDLEEGLVKIEVAHFMRAVRQVNRRIAITRVLVGMDGGITGEIRE